MSASSSPTSSPSKATSTKTPPTYTTIAVVSHIQTQELPQQDQKQRLQVYNSLFEQDNNKTRDEEMTKSDVENDLIKEQKQERNDDCVINNHANNIIVPSFIRLFVIRRIVNKYIKQNRYNNQETKEEMIKKLANAFKENKKT